MMDEKAISLMAYNGERPESALPHEWLLWYRLRDIYADVRAGRLVKQTGKAMKQDAVNSFNSEREAWERDTLLWKRIEPAATRFAKERTVEAACEFYVALYRMELPGLEKEALDNG